MKLNIKRDKQVNINTSPNWLTLLGVIFVIFKVTGITQVAMWSWWLVLLPFYVGLAVFAVLVMGVAALAGIVLGGAFLIDGINNLHRKLTRKKYK